MRKKFAKFGCIEEFLGGFYEAVKQKVDTLKFFRKVYMVLVNAVKNFFLEIVIGNIYCANIIKILFFLQHSRCTNICAIKEFKIF